MSSQPPIPNRAWSSIAAVILLMSLGMTSCSASQNETAGSAPEAELNDRALLSQESADLAPAEKSSSGPVQGSSIARQAPQLIKTANLTLRVEDVEQSLEQVDQILRQHQGDLLSLEEQQPRGVGDRYVSSLRLRVPQQNLNPILEALEALGSVQSRSIQAQDVSNQIVDSQARLKNLRKSEEVVLEIMERSGSIPDVLSASKELTQIRENIERLDAQVKNLQNQVAFSTVNVRLESLTTTSAPQASVPLQLEEAWNRSTRAMGDLTLAFVKLSIWGLAFSPYLLGLVLLIWLGRRYQKRPQSSPPDTDQSIKSGEVH